MKTFTPDFDTDFKVLHSTKRSQAAVMVLKAGESTGGEDINKVIMNCIGA